MGCGSFVLKWAGGPQFVSAQRTSDLTNEHHRCADPQRSARIRALA